MFVLCQLTGVLVNDLKMFNVVFAFFLILFLGNKTKTKGDNIDKVYIYTHFPCLYMMALTFLWLNFQLKAIFNCCCRNVWWSKIFILPQCENVCFPIFSLTLFFTSQFLLVIGSLVHHIRCRNFDKLLCNNFNGVQVF